MDQRIYQTGYRAGKTWAEHDASHVEMLLVHEFGDGETWAAGQRDAVQEFVSIIDPVAIGYMRSREPPSVSFVAGFIDGARTVESSSK